jgi:hypothetical protein
MYQLSKGLGQLNSVSVTDTAANIASLASGISKLGYKSATQAIENIPKLAKALSQLMATLSKAPSVSQNIISMTNALAKLSAQGSNVGTAAKNVSSGLNLYSKWTTTATKNTFSFASAIGKLYATYWLVFRAFSKIGEAIDYSSQLTEVQNVVDNTFGIYSDAIEDMASNSIQQLGMSALTVKQIGSTFQAMGKAVGFAQDEMADMSTSLVALTADMASFYDVEQEDVAEDLQAIFTGQTKPLRAYGIDLTQTTLKEWALNKGLNANFDSMTQLEKVQLRYQYVMEKTALAQGDFSRTSNKLCVA